MVAAAAGTRRMVGECESVGELLEVATQRLGPAFEALLPTCCVWVNGDEVNFDRPLADDDEVALLPPFSGG